MTDVHKEVAIAENTLRQLYEENSLLYSFQPDYSKIEAIMQLYEKMTFFENTATFLYDHKNMQLLYISENIIDILGYRPEELKAMGIGFYFKIFHPNHIGFPFRQIRIEAKLYPEWSLKPMINRKIYLAGLKLIRKNGQLIRSFLKVKALVVNEHNLPELSIIQGEDFSHFFKGNGYWGRFILENLTYCYVHNFGKKEFKDLISPSELKILRLIAKNKSTREISELLHLSTGTIDSHRKNMIARSGAINTTALVHLCKMAEIL